MASVTFSTPNNIEYGNGQVLISLDDTSVDDFTIYNVYIGSGNSWEWTFDIEEYLENNSGGGQVGVNPNLTVDTSLKGDYTFTFNGCTFTVEIKDLPTFNGNQCIDNCITYTFENDNNNVPVTFYYTDCYTGDVIEDTVGVNGESVVCACEGEYYDPSNTLTVKQAGTCFVCEYTTWVVGDTIDGQNVIDNVTLYYGGLEFTPSSSNPETFQMGQTSYDVTYIIPPGYQNSGQDCNIKIEDITVIEPTTTTTTTPPPSECRCAEYNVTNTSAKDVKFLYTDCDGNPTQETILKETSMPLCICLGQYTPNQSLIVEEIGLCDPNSHGGGLY